MTPIPDTGDIWEWTGQFGAGIVLFEQFESYDDDGENWQVIFLETGLRTTYHVSEDNISMWKQLA